MRNHALPTIRGHHVVDVLDGWLARYRADDESIYSFPAVVLVTTRSGNTYCTGFVYDEDEGWQRVDHWINFVGLDRD